MIPDLPILFFRGIKIVLVFPDNLYTNYLNQ